MTYSSDSVEGVVRQWFEEVWNKKRVEAIDELLAPDCKAHGLIPGGGVLIGPDGFKESHRVFANAFPDLQITLDEVLISGDLAATRFTVTGTHLGDTLGVAPTSRPVEFMGMTMARIRDGKIVEGWNVVDFLEMQRQIAAD